MRPFRAVALVVIAGLGIASLSSAAMAAVPGAGEEQRVGSTRLVSTGFENGYESLQAADVSDGGLLVTFGVAKVGPDPIYGRRPDMPRPTLVTPEGDVNFEEAVVAPDGSFAVFVEGYTYRHLYLRDVRNGDVTEIAKPEGLYGGESYAPSVSPDSEFVVFRSTLKSLAPGGQIGLGLYVYEVATSKITALDAGTGYVSTEDPAVSSSGRYVVFTSGDRLAEGDTDGGDDVFRYDSASHEIALVSGGSGPLQFPGARSFAPQISADGNRICYTAATGVVPSSNTPAHDDVYLTDLSTGVTQLVSRAQDGGRASGDSAACDISADGQLVTFSSKANDLVRSDTNGRSDIFVTAVDASATSLVSRNLDGHVPDGASYDPAISADGRYVAYESSASNLAAQDHDPYTDIFLTRLS